MASDLDFLLAEALRSRTVEIQEAPARFMVGAAPQGDPMRPAAIIAGVLAAYAPEVRLLSSLSSDVATVTLRSAAFTGDVGAAYDLANMLADTAKATAVEPDLPYAPEVEIDARPDAAMRESTILGGCWVGPDHTLPPDWAPQMVRAQAAWAVSRAAGRPVAGAGIIVAHLDTGLTSHPELDRLALLTGIDLIDGDLDPTDPLGYAGNPGHGTSTASVLASGPLGEVTGIAPAATLLPIRCIASVIVVLSGTVAQAIDAAVQRGAHIVTMSLGGLSSFALERALARAVAADVIVLAAAGNCVRTVVYPAADPNCLAIGGVNAQSLMWRGTCRGPEVDVSAPAENVLRAKAGPDGGEGVEPGEGTSYAVAVTAGVAACWLAHHGRARAIQEARRRRISLQEVFRQHLTATARTPASWPVRELGSGIVDAEALLQADLSTERREGGDGVAAQATNAGRIKNLMLAQFEDAEVTLAGLPIHAVRSEVVAHIMLAGSATRRASHRLTHAVGPQGLKALRVAGAEGPPPATPALVIPDGHLPTQREALLRNIRKQIVQQQPAFEGVPRESVPYDAELPPVDIALKNFDPANVDAFIARFPSGEVTDREAMKRALLAIHSVAHRGYGKMTDPRGISAVSPGEFAALEAVVNLDGSSPSLLLRDNKVDLDHPLIGAWQDQLAVANTNLIAKVAPAIGRIQPAGGGPARFFGTGARVERADAADPTLLLTNYHVAAAIMRAPDVQFRQIGNRIRILNGPVVDFGGELDSSACVTHKVVAVRLPEGVGQSDRSLDAVALEIEPLPGAPMVVSEVSLSAGLALTAGGAGDLLLIGFPGNPERYTGVYDGVDWNWISHVLFGSHFGYKRVAPGRILQGVGSLGADRHASVFMHDASTLGGSSGSLVFGFNTGRDAFGLHFAGKTRERNEAHAVGAAVDALRSIGLKVDTPGK